MPRAFHLVLSSRYMHMFGGASQVSKSAWSLDTSRRLSNLCSSWGLIMLRDKILLQATSLPFTTLTPERHRDFLYFQGTKRSLLLYLPTLLQT